MIIFQRLAISSGDCPMKNFVNNENALATAQIAILFCWINSTYIYLCSCSVCELCTSKSTSMCTRIEHIVYRIWVKGVLTASVNHFQIDSRLWTTRITEIGSIGRYCASSTSMAQLHHRFRSVRCQTSWKWMHDWMRREIVSNYSIKCESFILFSSSFFFLSASDKIVANVCCAWHHSPFDGIWESGAWHSSQ